MTLRAISYVSTAAHLLNITELDALLLRAREVNAEKGVTGALIYADGSFFQYFEGEDQAVEGILNRIKRSNLHYDIIVMLDEPTENRLFSDWHMGFANAPKSIFQQLAQAEWKACLPTLKETGKQHLGATLLVNFWKSFNSAN